MAPHAVNPSPFEEKSECRPQINQDSEREHSELVNGVSKNHQGRLIESVNHSHLRSASAEEVNDLICIGFGPASLAIAVALHDALEASASSSEVPKLNGRQPRVTFLERQAAFAWHAGMLLPGAKMQITFIKDLATPRNPRSEFTFLNYLHKHNRLVTFTNLGTFLPQRIEYEDYMRWCASRFDDVVEYGQDVLNIMPGKGGTDEEPIEEFVVTSKNLATNAIEKRRAKHVLVAVGGKPNIPKSFPQSHPRVIHSSQYSHVIPKMLTERDRQYRIAVIGGGQSAAEIFSNLHEQYPNAITTLLIRGSALRPSDDSPFVNEIFNPERVDDIYHQSPETRKTSITLDRGTNYGVVRLELLEHIYELLYTQRIKNPDESTWPLRILPYRTVTHIDASSPMPGGVRLHIRNDSGEYMAHETSRDETMDVDVVLVASGYRRNAHEEMLEGMRHLMRGGDGEGKRTCNVARDYRLLFEDGAVSRDAGIWLQGCNESTHGLSDTLLSILATRAGEIVHSIFGSQPNGENGF